MKPCECKSDWFICHPAKGCICKHGFTGSNCDEPLMFRNIQEKEEAGIGSIVAGVFAAIMVIAISLAAWFYHRRRVADLKKEMVQVQYIAEPVTPPDRTQFDNPVYSYQGSSRFDDGTATLLNNVQIRNDLSRKNINIEKMKLGGHDDDDESCRGAYGSYDHSAPQKNKEADLGNPNVNIYYSIDEMDSKKGEHFYEDIKHKTAEMEYDHLDYSPAQNEWKLNYHHMANGFGSKDGSGPSKSKDQDPECGRK